MEKTFKINKIQGFLLVFAGIVLISAMCFAVVFANFAITDKVASAEELPLEKRYPDEFTFGDYDTGVIYPYAPGTTYYKWMWCRQMKYTDARDWWLENTGVRTTVNIPTTRYMILSDRNNHTIDVSVYLSIDLRTANGFYCTFTVTSDYYGTCEFLVCDGNNNVYNYDLVYIPAGFNVAWDTSHINDYAREFLYYFTSCFDNFPVTCINAGWNECVDVYNGLVQDYNSLEEEYNALVESLSFVPLVDNMNAFTIGSYGSYGSDEIKYIPFSVDGDTNVLTISRFTDSSYDMTLGVLNLGAVIDSSTLLRIRYHILSPLDLVDNPVSICVPDGSGGLISLFTTTPDIEVVDNYYEFELTLPVDTQYLYFTCASSTIMISRFTVDIRSSANQILIDQAYQRGVDSVNTQYYINQGYEAGYYAGLSEDNPYTFRSLMGAVVDAPLDVFTQMFDFDILGVNMKGLYLSLFTLALVILVIKFALARG